MKYYYGNDYVEAINNEPVEINDVRALKEYEKTYNVVIPVSDVDEIFEMSCKLIYMENNVVGKSQLDASDIFNDVHIEEFQDLREMVEFINDEFIGEDLEDVETPEEMLKFLKDHVKWLEGFDPSMGEPTIYYLEIDDKVLIERYDEATKKYIDYHTIDEDTLKEQMIDNLTL